MEMFTDQQQLGPLTAQNISDVLSSFCGCSLPLNVSYIQKGFWGCYKVYFIYFIVSAELVSDLSERCTEVKCVFSSLCVFDVTSVLCLIS